MKKYYIFIVVLFIFSVIVGVAHEMMSRDKRADQKTLNELQKINDGIQLYADQKKRLPSSLNDITLPEVTRANLSNYIYKNNGLRDSRGDYLYELCGTFKRPSVVKYENREEYETYLGSAPHSAGNHCFKIKAYAPLLRGIRD